MIRAQVVPLLAVAALLAACTAGSHSGTGAGDVVPTLRSQVNAQSRLDLPVAGLMADPLLLSVQPGDFRSPGVVSSTISQDPGPERVPWLTPAGPVRELEVEGTLTRPLTLRFNAGPDHQGDVPVIWRRDAQLGWYPVAAGDAGQVATAQRSQFSPHLPTWANVDAWIKDREAEFVRFAGGRTTPPQCGSRPPPWASLDAPTLDVLLVCAGTNISNGVTRAELQVKNNRGLTQEIEIPADITYTDVEDQPESVRNLVRSLAGGRDIVLLPPGKRLTIGFVRPTTDRHIELDPQPTKLALGTDLVNQLQGLASSLGEDSFLLELLELRNCTGVDGNLLQGVIPSSEEATVTFLTNMSLCALQATSDLPKVVSVAQQYVSLTTHTSLAIVRSDEKFNPQVERAAGLLNFGGKLLAAANKVGLARYGFIVWESVSEMLGRLAAGDNDPAITRLNLTAKKTMKWTSPALIITARSLGDVRIGMTSAEAQQAAGATFDDGGDGAIYPAKLPAGFAHLYVHGDPVTCVGAGGPSPRQTISTLEGFRLGDTVKKLLAIYGNRAHYMQDVNPGLTANNGYVVAEASGSLAFAVDESNETVTEITGGPGVDPNSCPG